MSTIDAVRPDAGVRLPGDLAECRLGDGVLEAIAVAFGTPIETIDCIRASIDDAEVNALFASGLLGGGGGEAARRRYGADLMDGLPGDCSKAVSIALLLDGDAITPAQATCLEREMSSEVARLMIGPEGSGAEARAAVGALIEACPG